MAGVFKRRGQTWQNAEWRCQLGVEYDVNERARTALAKLRPSRKTLALAKPVESFSMARMPVPFFSDGSRANGTFSIWAAASCSFA